MGATVKISTHMLGDQRVGKIIEGKPLDTKATVQEAIDKTYMVGTKELITSEITGVFRAMAAAISRDGNGRKIDEVVSMQPSVKCKLADICDPVTKDNVEGKILARVLKDGALDTSGWTFVVEGATTDEMYIDSVTTGEEMDEITLGQAINFNGLGLDIPDTATLKFVAAKPESASSVTGSIAVSACTRSNSRLTTLADALSALTGTGWEGGTIVFTLTNGSAVAIKSATLHDAE